MTEPTMLNRLRRLSPKTLKADLSAGLTTALVAIPDGIASAILAGLNPIHGLYALLIGFMSGIAAHPRAKPAQRPMDVSSARTARPASMPTRVAATTAILDMRLAE